MKELYIIRHCQATGQEPAAPLTELGQQQAQRLVTQLSNVPLDRIVSSPYLRAMHTIAPLAQQLDLPVHTDERLIERVLCDTNEPDWRNMLRQTYDDMELCYQGGESSRQATERAIAVIHELQRSEAQYAAIVSHGNLISLLLRAYDDRIGFAEWEQLTNPDVYRLTFSGTETALERAWV
jgi:2,3-bisphosphoglycerate-dependent phosphoglycerate mutase